jgi:hypothetical protein
VEHLNSSSVLTDCFFEYHLVIDSFLVFRIITIGKELQKIKILIVINVGLINFVVSLFLGKPVKVLLAKILSQ